MDETQAKREELKNKFLSYCAEIGFREGNIRTIKGEIEDFHTKRHNAMVDLQNFEKEVMKEAKKEVTDTNTLQTESAAP